MSLVITVSLKLSLIHIFDDQLSKQFVGSKKYIGDETVVSIESREKLREELQGRESGGVYLTTICLLYTSRCV